MNILRLTQRKGGLASATLVLALLWPGGLGATDDSYINNGIVTVPPVVDATNFINNNQFLITTGTEFGTGLPFETFNTRNFTNRGTMTGDIGYRFSTKPSVGPRTMAANFNNTGLISAGSGFAFAIDLPRIIIEATNIVSRGTNIIGVDGLFQATGEHLDFSRSAIQMQSSTVGGSGVGGFGANYWGLGTNVISPPAFEQSPPTSPFHQIQVPTNIFGDFIQLVLTNGVGYTRDVIAGSNRTVQVAFVDNANPAFSNNVYFSGNQIAVEWIWQTQNPFTGGGSTNYMYLFDDLLGRTGTNIVLRTNFFSVPYVTAQPANYNFFFGGPFFLGTPWPVSPPAGTFPFGIVSNNYTAFGADFTASTVAPGTTPGTPGITNLPGRIEFNAGKTLDLSLARVVGLNYLKLSATNHFAGATGAKLLSAYTDVNLASTNGSLTVTNLLLPEVPLVVGDVNLYSARWEETANNVTNAYHVLFVQSILDTGTPSLVQDLKLRATNHITISDEFNILRSLHIDTENLTLTTNSPGSDSATGVLKLLTNAAVGPANFPRLRNLTNAGVISTANLLTLGTAGSPLSNIVNTGEILGEAVTLNVDLLVNPGLIGAALTSLGSGSLTLNAHTAYLTNGSFLAPQGDVIIAADTLVVSNNALVAQRLLSLSLTNLLDDGGLLGSNVWATGNDGFRLLHRPLTGDLLGTTITNTAGTFVVVPNQWAGEDRGRAPGGFFNNAALGRLILNGSTGTVFNLSAVAGTNALYVDLVELQGTTTDIDTSGNLSGLSFGPNMTLYYGDMVANGESIAERMNGKNNGGLQWVAGYAGNYSGTNVLYPDGTTNRLNRALVTSCNLDSDGDLTPNCADPTPVFVPSQLGFRASPTNLPPAAVTLTWNAIQDSTSTVFYQDALGDTNWAVLTNVTVTAVPPFGLRPVRVTDLANSSNRFYRVEVAVPQP